MDDTIEIFLAEAEEWLETIEQAALQLNKEGFNAQLVDELFRALHTLKGSGALAGFNDLSDFAHEVESAWVVVRERHSMPQDLPDLTLEAKDQFQAILEGSADPDFTDKVISRFMEMFPTSSPSAQRRDRLDFSKLMRYLITIDPGRDAFFSVPGPLEMLDELRKIGDCQIEGYFDRVPQLEQLNSNVCYVYWTAIVLTKKDPVEIEACFPLWTRGQEFEIEGPII